MSLRQIVRLPIEGSVRVSYVIFYLKAVAVNRETYCDSLLYSTMCSRKSFTVLCEYETFTRRYTRHIRFINSECMKYVMTLIDIIEPIFFRSLFLYPTTQEAVHAQQI